MTTLSYTPSRPLRSFAPLVGLCLFIMLAALLLPQIYASPLALHRDIGSEWVNADGLYSPEHNAELSYSYSDGDATLDFPESGTGSFVVEMRLGGPNGAIPVHATIETPNQQLNLGTVSELRVYHVLSTSDAQGDLDLQAQSGTATLPNESRQLGMLFDWIAVRSLGRLEPPPAVDILTPLILLMVGAVVIVVVPTAPRRFAVVAGAVVLLAASYALSRGMFAAGLWWMLGSSALVATLAAITISRQHAWTATRRIVSYFAVWRVLLWVVGAIGLWYSADVYIFGSTLTHHGEEFDRTAWGWKTFAEGWSRWDAIHYQSIAATGYTFDERFPTIAFFPLYPMLTRGLALVIGNVPIASLIISNVAFVGALVLLNHLLRPDFGDDTAERTALWMMLFPAAFFFGAAYSEALALLLLVACMWAIRRERWWLAGVFGALLTLTRIPGIFMTPIIALAYLHSLGWQWRKIRLPIVALVLPPLALLGFMLYQWQVFGTPFAFMLAQRAWKNELSLPWVIPITLITEIVSVYDREMKVWELIVWASFIVLVGVSLRRLRFPYGLAALLMLLPVYFSSFPGSIARQVLIAFPAFIMLAQIQSVVVRRVLAMVMFGLLILGTLLYVNGFWVG